MSALHSKDEQRTHPSIRRGRKSKEFSLAEQPASLSSEGPGGGAWEVPHPARCLLGCEKGSGGPVRRPVGLP